MDKLINFYYIIFKNIAWYNLHSTTLKNYNFILSNLGLALGGLYKGTSPLRMAAAYATIANNGVYIEPTFYTKVVDRNGNIIIEAKQEKERVFSEQNAYILKQLLIEPTKAGGTASLKSCKFLS